MDFIFKVILLLLLKTITLNVDLTYIVGKIDEGEGKTHFNY